MGGPRDRSSTVTHFGASRPGSARGETRARTGLCRPSPDCAYLGTRRRHDHARERSDASRNECTNPAAAVNVRRRNVRWVAGRSAASTRGALFDGTEGRDLRGSVLAWLLRAEPVPSRLSPLDRHDAERIPTHGGVSSRKSLVAYG